MKNSKVFRRTYSIHLKRWKIAVLPLVIYLIRFFFFNLPRKESISELFYLYAENHKIIHFSSICSQRDQRLAKFILKHLNGWSDCKNYRYKYLLPVVPPCRKLAIFHFDVHFTCFTMDVYGYKRTNYRTCITGRICLKKHDCYNYELNLDHLKTRSKCIKLERATFGACSFNTRMQSINFTEHSFLHLLTCQTK